MIMKRIQTYITLLVVSMVAALSLSSCGDEYYESSYLEGRWGLVSIDGYPISEPEYSEFTLYSNGTGSFGQYAGGGYGNWSQYPITWEWEQVPGGAEYLYVYPYSGGVWRYLLRLYPTQMELTDLSTGQVLVYQAF